MRLECTLITFNENVFDSKDQMQAKLFLENMIICPMSARIFIQILIGAQSGLLLFVNLVSSRQEQQAMS